MPSLGCCFDCSALNETNFNFLKEKYCLRSQAIQFGLRYTGIYVNVKNANWTQWYKYVYVNEYLTSLSRLQWICIPLCNGDAGRHVLALGTCLEATPNEYVRKWAKKEYKQKIAMGNVVFEINLMDLKKSLPRVKYVSKRSNTADKAIILKSRQIIWSNLFYTVYLK